MDGEDGTGDETGEDEETGEGEVEDARSVEGAETIDCEEVCVDVDTGAGAKYRDAIAISTTPITGSDIS